MTHDTFKPTSMLNEKQASEIVGVAVPTLRSWRQRQKAGQPPFHKIGGAVRYRFCELNDWLESNAVSY